MATTTPNFGWSVPTSTDLVKDGATAIETLGDSIDASFLDLKGGTTGQVLSKASNTDLDYTWVTTDDANAIQNSIVDAKGDLIAATGADTPARLAVGTNGYNLIADSTAATGLAWAQEGFTYITSSTFSATSVSVNNCFSASYNTYLVTMFTTGSGGTCTFKLRLSGTDSSASYYDAKLTTSGTTGTTVTGSVQSNVTTGFKISPTASQSTYNVNMIVTNPSNTNQTHYSTLPAYGNDSSPSTNIDINAGKHNVTTAYDGFTLTFSTSTPGTVRVYGLRTS
jgi:hypothetical protein